MTHSRINTVSSSDRGVLVHGDNLPWITSLPDGVCDLIYIDPPFMTDRVRTTAAGQHHFDDRWPDGITGYLEFLRPRIEQMHRLLPDHGSLYVHLDWRSSHHVRLMLEKVFGPEQFLNEIIWSYRTGGTSKHWFPRKHDTILLLAKHAGKHVFNVQRDGQYRTDGLLYDDSGQPFKKTRKGPVFFHRDGPAITDVWDIPFLSTVSSERCGFPSQKPLALARRIIAASSRPGDSVADFFCGSGTTLLAAQESGRRWMGCDISADAVRLAAGRLNNAARPDDGMRPNNAVRPDDAAPPPPGRSADHSPVTPKRRNTRLGASKR